MDSTSKLQPPFLRPAAAAKAVPAGWWAIPFGY
jgi:hypothetical protein